MSYFLFGAFNSVNNVKKLQQIKANGLENDIYIWFDEEITFYKDKQVILLAYLVVLLTVELKAIMDFFFT